MNSPLSYVRARSAEQKEEIAKQLTDLLVDVGKTERDHVWIRYVDSPKSDWAMGGEVQG